MNLIVNATEAIGDLKGEINVSLTKTAIRDGFDQLREVLKSVVEGTKNTRTNDQTLLIT
jgi:hypothetical protein